MTGRWKPRWLQKLIKRTSTLGSEKPNTRLSTDRLTNHTDQLVHSPQKHLLKSCLLDSDSTTTSPSIDEQPAMADGEEDFSSLPLTDRWVHKVWKVRKQAYEEAAQIFEKTPDEYDPAFRPFIQDPSLWKTAVADSNVAAQQDGLAALCAFLKFGGREGGVRARQHAVTPICEKGLSSTRAATKASAVEALLLFVEIDVPGPVIEEILPVLSNKQPKVVAAAINALTQIFHNYGCKTADPKPVLKILPKVFGHADKNVRAEATGLAVEFYRWLREAMKPMFWGDLKPTQQTDLEAQFEKIKAEGPAKQERLLRSQQAAKERAPAAGGGDEYGEEAEEEEEVGEVDAFDLAEPQDVISKVPKDFYDNLASSKWKERKEACEALYAVVNVPRIKDGDFAEITRCLAKCMKDANIAVVTQAAQCIEMLAKGLRKGFAKYRSNVMQPIMERLKEKKVTVADALGAALDAVFLSTNLTDCLEDITTFLVHKNPQVKEGIMKFLVRCLRTTRDVPSKQEIASIVECAKKLLSEGSEVLRSGGAEILGTIMKIIGERAMNPHLEGLDDIRKTKIKEFFETAEVKAKDKPKPPPPAPAARGPPPKKTLGGKKAPPGLKKAPPAAAAPPPEPSPPPAPPAAARPGPGSKLGKPGLGGLKAPQKRTLGGPGAGAASPRRPVAPRAPSPAYEPEYEEEEPIPASPPPKPRIGLGRGGLAGRSLAKPAAPSAPMAPASPSPTSTFSHMERAELEELRMANERLLKQLDDARHDRSKLASEIQELKNQNAQLIEDHTRDVLSIKAKETQLVRARSDAEAAEQTNERLRRELDRLKRALSKAEALNNGAGADSPVSPSLGFRALSPTHDDGGMYRDNAHAPGAGRARQSFASTLSEEKENGDGVPHPRKMAPESRYAGSTASSGRASPARGFRRDISGGDDRDIRSNDGASGSGAYGGYNDRASSRAGSRAGSRLGDPPTNASGGPATSGMESWRRAAEVTSQLKARIEMMKAKAASRPQ
ncbi:armadillo-type protein [Cercophora samala]|uniref:Armadillo-type protein n=1 Tax=Cercophora samala TaxID=330535 RepID=A0AA39Z009_9PEZI|nr:armadillo-type protein [Cercophora samala]